MQSDRPDKHFQTRSSLLNNAISKVAYDNDVDSIKTGEKLYRPAVKLSK